MGLPAEEADLSVGAPGPVADLAFTGRGEGGKPVEIGVEFKKLSELIGSLRTERLQGEQLPSMRKHYDLCWLIIEGEQIFGPDGRLLRRTGRRLFRPLPMSVGELRKRILVLHICWGLNPIFTQNRRDTLKWIEALYRTWTDTDQDQHKSHLGIYQPPTPEPVSEFRQIVIKHLPGIGFKASEAVEAKFKGSLKRAWNASAGEWASIEIRDTVGKTRKLGPVKAERIMQVIEGTS